MIGDIDTKHITVLWLGPFLLALLAPPLVWVLVDDLLVAIQSLASWIRERGVLDVYYRSLEGEVGGRILQIALFLQDLRNEFGVLIGVATSTGCKVLVRREGCALPDR